jgi:hypothetical protein
VDVLRCESEEALAGWMFVFGSGTFAFISSTWAPKDRILPEDLEAASFRNLDIGSEDVAVSSSICCATANVHEETKLSIRRLEILFDKVLLLQIH